MKRYIISFILIIVLIVMNGCNYTNENYHNSKQSQKEKIQNHIIKRENKIIIGATIAAEDSSYLRSLIPYMKEAAKEKEIELVLEYAEWSVEKQQQQIDEFIEMRVDAIILCPINAKSMLTSLKEAKEADIPVVNLNMKVDSVSSEYIETYVGASMTEEGVLAAKLIKKGLENKGGKVAIIEGAPGSDAQIFRTQAFFEEMKYSPNMEIVAIGNGNWERQKAYLVAWDIINKNEELDAIFCHDSNMAIGALKAIEEANKQNQIIVIGISENEEYLKAIEDNRLYGLITQPPSYEGKYSVYASYDAALGKELVPWYRDPIKIVTKENVSEYLN